MMIVHGKAELEQYLEDVYAQLPGYPSILLDEFLADAKEIDVDAISDGETTVIAGLMEHIEAAGVHSGDSACITPPASLGPGVIETIRRYSVLLAQAIGVRGLINIQFIVRGEQVFVIEANPRASRTIPYLSKAIGHPLAKYAALISAGQTLQDLGFTETPIPDFFSVKEVVLPFLKFRDLLPVLGPEMRSTGESMGIDKDAYLAYYKAQVGANAALPTHGKVLLIGEDLQELGRGFELLGFEVTRRPDSDSTPRYQLLIDTAHTQELRRALEHGIPYLTSRQAAEWALKAIAAAKEQSLTITSVQELHAQRQDKTSRNAV
jgi:carbamoyl-phosphate synthase large subunit